MPVDQLSEADLPALQRLARTCLDADGGLPAFADVPLLRTRLLREQTVAIREDGELLAAAGLSRGEGQATTSGLVAPSARRRGLGTRLLAWAEAGAGDDVLTVATETCGPDAERLYARHRLVRSFAEWVLRHDLLDLPTVPRPDGITVVPVTEADPADVFAAYVGSFADRPGFRRPTVQEWLEDLRSDEDWRRDLSVVVLADDGAPAGFLNLLGRWVDQVGVVPAWRGRGLGAYLVARTLHALATEGSHPVGLTVNVDNPAAGLYRRLGFRDAGLRARYTQETPTPT